MAEKNSFWGRPIKDKEGNILAYQDEFGDVRTPRVILHQVACALAILMGMCCLMGGCISGCRERNKERAQRVGSNLENKLLP